LDKHREQAIRLLKGLASALGDGLVAGIIEADQSSEAGISAQRQRVMALKDALAGHSGPEVLQLMQLADHLVRKNVWIVGADGWGYGLRHWGHHPVLSMLP